MTTTTPRECYVHSSPKHRLFARLDLSDIQGSQAAAGIVRRGGNAHTQRHTHTHTHTHTQCNNAIEKDFLNNP